jgi:hypothetical protein
MLAINAKKLTPKNIGSELSKSKYSSIFILEVYGGFVRALKWFLDWEFSH